MTNKELAAAIRKGHTMIPEGKVYMYPSTISDEGGCALCAAWYGAGKTKQNWRDLRRETGMHPIDAFNTTFLINRDLLCQIDSRHSAGESRLSLADWLETLEPGPAPTVAPTPFQARPDFQHFMDKTLAQLPEKVEA